MTDRKNVLKLHSEQVQDNWLDAYGHLNEAYYLVPFSNATWALQEHFAIGVEYFNRTGIALYTLESHVRYLKEVRAPAVMEIETMILGLDSKRLRIGHVMRVDGAERATFECLGLFFDTRTGRTAQMSDDVQAALRASMVSALPDWAGRGVGLDKK